MMCRDRVEALWAKGIAFPLERLHHLITNEVWSDPDSEKLWNQTYPNSPYQVWNADPTSTASAVLKLQNIEMTCPWCRKLGSVDLNSFRAMHVTKTSTCHFQCGHAFTADSLSAKYLKDDLLNYIKTGNAWYIPSNRTNIGVSKESLSTQMVQIVATMTSTATSNSSSRQVQSSS
jgi:hypothetical protein